MIFNMNRIIGAYNLLFITLDTLRYDVAQQSFNLGKTPHFAQVLPANGWEMRHTPGSFTYSAHHAFFAGFLPTPATPGQHPRLFSARFEGSLTTTENTFVFDAPEIVTGLAQHGYHTICIGGVGFFNKRTPLSSVLPNLFAESYWSPALGVAEPDSTENQFVLAGQAIANLSANQRFFLFLNISALHQPNYFYLPGATNDSPESQAAALEYVDQQLPLLWANLQHHGPIFCIICSDHGTAYGEAGYQGHRLSHPVVWTVPYAEFILEL